MANVAEIEVPTFMIRVAPDESAPVPDPQVLLTNRDLSVTSVPAHLIWQKLPASKKFKMVSLKEIPSTNGAFKNITVENRKIECDFDPPVSGKEYEYILTIEYKGTEYTTSTRGGPTEGRPVIRN